MSEQLSFLDGRPSDGVRPIARNSDPLTSHQAARDVPLNEQMLETLAALRGWLGEPPTSHELAGHDLMLRYRYGRRLPDLREVGLVENGPSRRCAVTGKQALTWILKTQTSLSSGRGATHERSS